MKGNLYIMSPKETFFWWQRLDSELRRPGGQSGSSRIIAPSRGQSTGKKGKARGLWNLYFFNFCSWQNALSSVI